MNRVVLVLFLWVFPMDYCTRWAPDTAGTSQCVQWSASRPSSIAAVRASSPAPFSLPGLPNLMDLGNLPSLALAGGLLAVVKLGFKKN